MHNFPVGGVHWSLKLASILLSFDRSIVLTIQEIEWLDSETRDETKNSLHTELRRSTSSNVILTYTAIRQKQLSRFVDARHKN